MRFCQAVSAKKGIRHADILYQWPSGSKVNRLTHVYLKMTSIIYRCVYVCVFVCLCYCYLFIYDYVPVPSIQMQYCRMRRATDLSRPFSLTCFTFCTQHAAQQTTDATLGKHHHHHNRFTALFPGPPARAGARKELPEFMVQGKINRGRHTDHPAGRHSIRTNKYLASPSVG